MPTEAQFRALERSNAQLRRRLDRLDPTFREQAIAQAARDFAVREISEGRPCTYARAKAAVTRKPTQARPTTRRELAEQATAYALEQRSQGKKISYAQARQHVLTYGR